MIISAMKLINSLLIMQKFTRVSQLSSKWIKYRVVWTKQLHGLTSRKYCITTESVDIFGSHQDSATHTIKTGQGTLETDKNTSKKDLGGIIDQALNFSKDGPVVQSIISLTSWLVFKMLTVLVNLYNILSTGIFAEKMWVAFANAKATHIFSAKILAYTQYLIIKVLTMLTNNIVSFEQLNPHRQQNNKVSCYLCIIFILPSWIKKCV